VREIPLFLLLMSLCVPIAAQDQPAGTWRRVAAFGRGGIAHADIGNEYILIDSLHAAWLYRASTLQDVARLELQNGRLSNDGQYIYGHKYSEPFITACLTSTN
jgi:hypothetical protein